MSHLPHWAYYMSLESDLMETSRYVEISDDNFDTYSIHFARLLLAAASEVDIVAKVLCKQIEPHGKHKNIDHYQRVIVPAFPATPQMELGIQWSGVRLKPWASWGSPSPSNPDWWSAYNEVKHQRNLHFKKGNLRNALTAIAGLFCLIRHLQEDKGQPKPNRFLRIES